MRPGSNSIDQMRRRAGERHEEALDLLRSWVAVNSHTRNRRGIEEMAARTAEPLSRLGFEEQVVPSGDPTLGDHRVFWRGSQGPQVVLVSHLDTVYTAEEEQRSGFAWRREGDWVVGPGVADIKGGTVVAWLALALLAEQRADLFEATRWRFLLNASEEEGSASFPGLAREVVASPGSVAALVFEHGTLDPTGVRSRVTVSRRGSARFRVEARGRAAHSGSAHAQGISALRQLAREIERIEGWTDYDRGLTFNVGLARGGQAINTVPERATAWVDMRADDPHAFTEGVDHLLSRSGGGGLHAASDGAEAAVEVIRIPDYPPWPQNAASEALAARATDVARELGLRVETEHRLGASDGCHVWDLVPTLDGLGPIGRHIHCALDDPPRGRHAERMLVASIPERAALVAGLLERLLSEARPG